MTENLRGPLFRDFLEPERSLVSLGRLEADRALGFGRAKQPVEHREVVVEGQGREALAACEEVGVVGGLLELGGVETVQKCSHVEDQDLERVVSEEIESPPVRVVEHQLDVRPLGDDLSDPAVVSIVLEDLGVEGFGLPVGDPVEIDAVEITEGGELIAVEARAARVVEVMPGARPPGVERLPGLAGGQRPDLGVIAAPPESEQGHPPAAVGLHQAGKSLERPEVVVGIDRRHGIEPGLDPTVGV